MGEVWRARHVLLGRESAVKLIRPDMLAGSDPEKARTLLRRFQREVKATSALRSPHTVEIYDFGDADDGTFYYAMELLDGLNLQTLVERRGPVPAGRAVHFLLQACDSLGEAHRQGLIHRDVKPANLFACQLGLQSDFIKVLDFGLVKPAAGQGDSQLTADSSALGSPAFMPPEVARGQKAIDARSDVYALGCVAYWLLTGQLVFEGESALQLVLAHLQCEPMPPSQRANVPVPAALEELILRCLRKEPAERPEGMRELAAALRVVAAAEPWSQEQAEAWWREHGDARLAALPTMEMAPPGPAAVPGPTAVAAVGAPAARPVSPKVLEQQREQAIVALQEQFVQSHIGATQLGERIAAVHEAGAPAEIDAQLADLPEVPGKAALQPVAAAPVAPVPVVTGVRTFAAVFGGRVVTGVWYPPPHLRTIAVFGGTQIDFRRARMQPGMTTLNVLAWMGGCEIIVPPGLFVQVDGVGIFGGFAESPTQESPPPQAHHRGGDLRRSRHPGGRAGRGDPARRPPPGAPPAPGDAP